MGNRPVKSYPTRRSAYARNRKTCVYVDTVKSLGADTILIYLVLDFSFFYNLFFLLLDCAADRKGILLSPGSRFLSVAFLHPI